MNERGYQHVVDTTRRWVNYTKKVTVTVNEILSQGRGWFMEKKIEMPAWVSRYDVSFRIYYVVHELTHCMVGVEHNKNFKTVEDKLLSLWDIRIKRRSVYPKAIYRDGKKISNVPESIS